MRITNAMWNLAWIGGFVAALAGGAVKAGNLQQSGGPVLFPPGAAGEVRVMARADIHEVDRWGRCNLPADKPLRYELARSAGRDGGRAIRMIYDADTGPLGMKYFQLPKVAGSDGFAFWVRGDGSGATLLVRLSQGDWSAWDAPRVVVDFHGWRRIVVRREQCDFHNWGGNGRAWDKIKVFAPRISGQDCDIFLDDLQFLRNTAAIQTIDLPPAPPVNLTIDGRRELAPVSPMLRGVDFALINWSAKAEDVGFGPRRRELFRQSGAKLVRFWTYCPPLEVSPAEGEYNWDRFDAQMRAIQRAGARAIMTCCFTPGWLSVDGSKEGLPSYWGAYERLIADTVRHCREQGFDVAYWEAWNEPDLHGGRFLKGDLDDFLELYGHFARAVRSADPNAKVGGPGCANANVPWIDALAAHCKAETLPLDFVSWHVYDLSPRDTAGSVDAMRRTVERHGLPGEVELLIDEWNVSGGPENAYDTAYAAAGQAATLMGFVDRGLDASTIFCFNDSSWEAGRQEFGGAWGLITHTDLPKAPFHAFQAFTSLTGPRWAVTGGDREIAALACRAEDGVDVVVGRFQPQRLAEDRDVTLSLREMHLGERLRVTVDLVDGAHSNPLWDRGVQQLQRVAVLDPVPADRLAELALPLRPWSVARIGIRPSKVAGDDVARAHLQRLPAVGPAAEATVSVEPGTAPAVVSPGGWRASVDGGTLRVTAPAVVPRRHHGYVVTTDEATGRSSTQIIPAVPSGLHAKVSVDAAGPWKAGQSHQATVRVRNHLGAEAETSVDLSARGAAVRPLGEGRYRVVVDDSAAGGHVVLRPTVRVDRLMVSDGAGRRPLSVAIGRESSDDPARKDRYSVLAGSFRSAAEAAKLGVQVESGGIAFGEGGAGPGEGAIRLSKAGASWPATAGTVELELTPAFDGPDAPDWGTPLLHSGAGGWQRNRWELVFRRPGGKPVLRFSLNDAAGRGLHLDAPIDDWQAGRTYRVLASWNTVTGRLALAIDGRPVAERTAERSFSLVGGPMRVTLNHTSGRRPSRCAMGAIRVSRVERVVTDELTAPAVPVFVRGWKVPVEAGR